MNNREIRSLAWQISTDLVDLDREDALRVLKMAMIMITTEFSEPAGMVLKLVETSAG